jgi:hypothetical protein
MLAPVWTQGVLRCRNRVFALVAHRLKSVGEPQSGGRGRVEPLEELRGHPLWTVQTRRIRWAMMSSGSGSVLVRLDGLGQVDGLL